MFDEFQFTFNLLDENDWDQYNIITPNKETQNLEKQERFNYRGRRLIEGYEDNEYTDLYDNERYQFITIKIMKMKYTNTTVMNIWMNIIITMN